MIIAQAPLRISLFGGGSDLPAFLEHSPGAVLSFAINTRIYVIGHQFRHRNGISLKYSNAEDVERPELLKHPIAREILTNYNLNDLDIAVISDLPAGTGLGSSSAFTVAFTAFVRKVKNLHISDRELAFEACDTEINKLKEPIGFQDQWASALGGMNLIRFSKNETVKVERVDLPRFQIAKLENNLKMIKVGQPRNASKILAEQSSNLRNDAGKLKLTSELLKYVELGKEALSTDLDNIGPLLHESWRIKSQISNGITNTLVDETYSKALEWGATGGKLLGAGGSGYLLLYVPEHNQEKFSQKFTQKFEIEITNVGAGAVGEP